MNWRSDKPASLYYVEALDGGDPATKIEYRDAVYQWDVPFTNEPKLLLETTDRFAGVIWGTETTAVAYDNWFDTRNVNTYLFNPSDASQQPKIINSRNSQDAYSDPGNFETRKNQFGRDVLLVDTENLFLIGDGFTPKGQFPFIDQFSLKTLKPSRIYQSALTDKLERIISIMDVKKGEIFVQLQLKTEYPNYFIRNLKKKIAPLAVTQFPNPFESIKDVEKTLIKYKRLIS